VRVTSSPSHLTVDDDATVVQGPLGSLADDELDEAPRSLGRYLIIAEVGVGGMGRVYRAYDPELDREVALKLLRRVTEDARSRLRREAQAMAQLAHPNVLPIYDVADDGRRMFIAMELVRGKSAREWLDAGPRSWSEVLEVFMPAGEGLAAAHEAGLVHRDFKPGNVLLGEDGRVRVMDFGLARGTSEPGDGSVAPRSSDSWHREPDESQSGIVPHGAAARSLRGTDSHEAYSSSLTGDLTQLGTVVGTPAYMAPEQHLGHTADPRCDQYGFCVTLWEALHGRRPFEAESIADWYLAKTTATPKANPDRVVPRWLQAVLLRGLAPRPDDRHPSMPALLHALAQATRRRRQRRRLGLGLAGVVLALGLAAALHDPERMCAGAEDKLVGVWDDGAASEVEEALLGSTVGYAADTWERVEPLLDDYAARWQAAHTDACEATHVRREQPEALMDARMRCLEDRRRDLRALVRTLRAADAEIVERSVSAVGALPAIEPCADPEYVRAQALPPTDPAQAAEAEALDEELSRIKALVDAGQAKQVEEPAREALRRAQALGHAPLEARAHFRLGWIEDDLGRYESGAEHLEQAYFIAQREGLDTLQAETAVQLMHVVGDNLDLPEAADQWARHAEAALERAHDPAVEASYLGNLGLLALDRADYEQAITLQERALALREQQLGPDHPQVAAVLNNLALVYDALSRFDQAKVLLERALAIRERALAPTHPEVASSLLNLANVHQTLADPERAREQLLRALAIYESAYGRQHPMVAGTLVNLGNVQQDLGEAKRALASYHEALPILVQAHGADHHNAIGTLVNIGSVLRTLGETERAREHYERALALLEKTRGAEFLHAVVQANMGSMELDADDLAAAEQRSLRGLELVEASTGTKHPLGALIFANLATVRSEQGQHEEALRLAREALGIRRELLGARHPETATSLLQVGAALVEAGKAGDAVEMLEEAVEIYEEVGGDGPRGDDETVGLHHARFWLARAWWDAEGDRTKARELAVAARDGLVGMSGEHEEEIGEIEGWLAAHGR
jgi:tetratricopeptide (TPR) repeat protein/tRNA A-37 threonylcarbamoyl transferase component Bud32